MPTCSVGASLVEEDKLDLAKDLIAKAKVSLFRPFFSWAGGVRWDVRTWVCVCVCVCVWVGVGGWVKAWSLCCSSMAHLVHSCNLHFLSFSLCFVFPSIAGEGRGVCAAH